MFVQDNISRTREIAENSWDMLHPDIAQLLLRWIVSLDGEFIQREEERVFVKIHFLPGTLIPETSWVQPIYTLADVEIFRLSGLWGSSIWQKVNGNIVRCPKITERQDGTCSVVNDDTWTDVDKMVHRIFPLWPVHPHRLKEAKYEESSAQVRENNRTLVEQIIASN